VKRILALTAASALAVAAGCNQNKPPASASLTPTPAVAQLSPMPEQTPAPIEAAVAQQPIDTSTPTPMSDVSMSSGGSFGSASTSGGKYTVKTGDTLYHIALSHYGEGKQWKKIALANPGVSPSHLRVGQVLVLP
jgi:5'-nucleotidase